MTQLKIVNKSHFGIYAVILKNNSILLVSKSRGPYKGKLDLPGGRPEFGEIPIQTLKREVLEETGLVVNKVQLFDNYGTIAEQIFHQECIKENIHHLGMIYLVNDFDESGLIREMDAEDSLGAQWYKLDSLNKDDLSPFAFYAADNILNP